MHKFTKATNRASTLPANATERKKYPIATGVLDYFPDAIVALAHLSWKGNEQHNPGEPLHWAREKSTDQDDTTLRHFMERGKRDADGERHTAKAAWRLLALLQLEIEEDLKTEQEALVVEIDPVFEGNRGDSKCCLDQAPNVYGWECERPSGHSGKHVAWLEYDRPNSPNNVAYEGGVWE